jgi:hypothetical protein
MLFPRKPRDWTMHNLQIRCPLPTLYSRSTSDHLSF